MLTDKLTKSQKRELLRDLFGLKINRNNILVDEKGDEFYKTPSNCQFDFDTLSGFFSYMAYKCKNQGYSDAQYDIKKVLGLN